MPTIEEVLSDKDFYGLPQQERLKVLAQIDADFAGLPVVEQRKALHGLGERQKSDTWQGSVSRFARPALEGGGAAIGTVIGGGAGMATGPAAPAASPVLAVAGGGLGYAIGKRVADTLDESLGMREAKPLAETAIESAQDVATGAALEMGGAALVPAFMAIKSGGKTLFRLVADPVAKAMTKTGAEKAAGNIIRANTSAGPIFAKNADEAAEIESRIPGLKFTSGQKTNDPSIIKLERSQIRGTGSAAELSARQTEQNNEALRAYYQRNFGGEENIDDLLANLQGKRTGLESAQERAGANVAAAQDAIPAKNPQQTGMDIIDTVDRAKKPVQSAMGDLEAEIPDYPMRFASVEKSIKELLESKKLSIGERKAILSAKENIKTLKGQGETTHTAMGMRRTLNDDISRLFNVGDDSAATSLIKIRDALESDLNAVSSLARTGKIKLYKGQTVYPDDLAQEFERNAEKIAGMQAQRTPDVKLMAKELQAQGVPFGRVPGEAEGDYVQRISADFARRTGKPAPVIDASGGVELKGLTDRNATIRGILREVEPGQDVAAAMNAYNSFASKNYFQRFARGATQQATAKGQQFSGTRTRAENIPQMFMTKSGSDDLIRAVGKEDAGFIMKGHASYDLLQNVTKGDGAVDTGKLNRWLSKNTDVLQKLGIFDDFKSIGRAQEIADAARLAAKDFEKSVAARMLNVDPEKAVAAAFSGRNAAGEATKLVQMVGGDRAALRGLQNAFADNLMSTIQTTAKDVAGNPIISNAAFQKTMAKYSPVMRVIYRDQPEKIVALNTMRRAYEVGVRNTKSPIGGGSDTAENILTQMGKLNLFGKTAAIGKGVFKALSRYGDDQINDMVNRALFDADYAEALFKATSKGVSEKDIAKIIDGKIVQLSDYRNIRRAAASTGITAASGVGE